MLIDEVLIRTLSSQAKDNERLRKNYNLHDSLDAKSQRLLNALEPGTILPIHRHLHTSETYILLKGAIDVLFYNEDGSVAKKYELNPLNGIYGVHIPKGQWHTMNVHESSVIFESKDGPYVPLTSKDIMTL